MRIPLLTRTDQKLPSLAFSIRWKLIPGLAGLSCKSKAVVLTTFCSSAVNFARLSVKVSAIRKSNFHSISQLRKRRINHDYSIYSCKEGYQLAAELWNSLVR